MNTLRMLASPRVWGPVLGMVAVLALVFYEVTGSPAAGAVEWARPETRGGALEIIGNDEYYGAIVIPKDYTQRISDIANPPTIPIAVVALPPFYQDYAN
jgi:hypothetical protein